MSAVSKPRSAEEIAREMVPEPERIGSTWHVLAVSPSTGRLANSRHWSRVTADEARDETAAHVARFIEQRDAEHAASAAAEREHMAALLRAARRWHATMSDDGGPAEEQIAADMDLTEAVEALDMATIAAPQPRDLAGRLRALVMQQTGEWMDRTGAEVPALREVMSLMRDVAQSGAHADSLMMLVEQLRAKDDSAAKRAVFLRAADELEAIVRECAEAQQ